MERCTECGKSFTLADKLRYIKLSGEKIKCNNCGTVFVRKHPYVRIANDAIATVIGLLLYFFALKGLYNNMAVNICIALVIALAIKDILTVVTFNIGEREKQ